MANQQAKKASQQVEQALIADILVSLYDLYNSKDMHKAIEEIWQAMKQRGEGVNKIGDFLELPNRYQFLQKYVDQQAEGGKEKELDESRRMVTHFWYLIANLLNKGVLQKEDAFEWFGPPDVVWVLEGLEAIKQNRDLTGGRTKTRWPPLQALDDYYKLKGIEVLEDYKAPIVRIKQETIDQIKKL